MLIILIVILAVGLGQQQTTLTQPPQLETSTFKLTTNSTEQFNFSTIVTFVQNFTSEPLVYISLVSLDSLFVHQTSTFTQIVQQVSTISFTLEANLSLSGTSNILPKIGMLYLAFDYPSYPFLQFLPSNIILPASSSSNIYLSVNYLPNISNPNHRLNPANNYSLNVVLSGYKNMALASSGTPSLYIDALQYNTNSYLLNIKTNSLTVNSLQILRLLIDTTQMEAAITGLSSLYCTSGDIVHFSDPEAIQNNNDPDFLPFAMLYGVKGWQGLSFSLTNFVYIFNNTNPPAQVTIGYILFQTKSCPTNQLYVPAQNLCYSRGAAFYYQLTPSTMAPCPYSCYACVGPLSTQCRSCMEGSHRFLFFGRCLCNQGFYDNGSPTCLNCSLAIQGCYTCNSAVNCLTCQQGCTAISFNPIYCDCPTHIQANYSYNCPSTYYYDHDSQKCSCLPQTYYHSLSNKCYPCGFACYICVNETLCLICIDSFTLTHGKCIFYQASYYLLGQGLSLNSPYTRCLRWDPSSTICLQRCKKYYYQFNCYGVCPTGTFNISIPWKTCQPCKINCQMCYNFTVCLHCITEYVYFNTSTFNCDLCGQHCVNCIDSTTCTNCEQYYTLNNGKCIATIPPNNNCNNSCNYCLANTCIQCKPTYYLNNSNQQCYSCLNNRAFTFGPVGQCIQICGDGIVVFAQCDDGNTLNGDGCSSICKIEPDYQCDIIRQKSYCWNPFTPLNWIIYPLFSKNQFVLAFNSERQIKHPLLHLQCYFNHSLTHIHISPLKIQYHIEYQQTIITTHHIHDLHNRNTIIEINSTNKCQLKLGAITQYTIIINANPQTLYIDYHSIISTLTQSQTLIKICTLSTMITVAIFMVAIVPSSSLAGLRMTVLILVTFLDYYQMPINSFTPYLSSLSILLTQENFDTRNLIRFSSDYYFQLLWKLSLLYFAVVFLHEILFRYIFKIIKSTDLKYLTKLTQHIIDNKVKIYQSFYTSYDVISIILIIKVYQHIKESDPKLIFFATLQLAFWIGTKIHLFFTYNYQQTQHNTYTRVIAVDQLQNASLAILLQFSSNSLSYTPFVIVLFAVYNISALFIRFNSKQKKEDSSSQFHISQRIAFWQFAINLNLLIIFELLKCGCIWRGIGGLTPKDYESIGQSLGIAINLLGSITLILNAFCTVICLLIKMCELTYEKEESSEVATVDHPSVEILQMRS